MEPPIHLSLTVLFLPSCSAKEKSSIFFFPLVGNTSNHESHLIAVVDSGVGAENCLDQNYKCFQFLEDSVYVEIMDD